MLALRKRRRSMKGSSAWRPQRTFEFAVWRLGDKIAVRDALQSAVIQGEAIARKHGLAFDANTGTDADGPALLAGLSHADLTCIACHGRILPNQDAVDLMVASGGLLPPAAATALESSDAKGHVLGWRQLADLQTHLRSSCPQPAISARRCYTLAGSASVLSDRSSPLAPSPSWSAMAGSSDFNPARHVDHLGDLSG